jgi:hypothetical protein
MDIHERVQGAEDNLTPEEWPAAEAHAVECPSCAEILGLGPPPEGELVEAPPPRFRLSRPALKVVFAAAALAAFTLFGAVFQAPEVVEAAESNETLAMVIPERPIGEVEPKYKSLEVIGGGGGGRRMLRGSAGGGMRVEEAPAPPPAIPYRDGQKVVRNAEVEIEVDSYAAFHGKLVELMSAAKGYLAGETKRLLPNGKTEATLTLRIPPEGFETLLVGFAELGTVRHQSVRTEDITKAYIDLESRLKSKETLAARLRAILANAKGEVQELVEAEAHLAATGEEIERLKGEIRYYDNLTGFATVTLKIAERDLGRPFEYVQTLAGRIGLTSSNSQEAFARAQTAVTDAGGRVVEARIDGLTDGSLTASLKARIDAEKYPALRTALRALGHPAEDRLEQKKTPQGGTEESGLADGPLRKALATLDLTVSPLMPSVTRKGALRLETAGVESAYQAARAAVDAASGMVLDGCLSGSTGAMTAKLRVQIDADKIGSLLERFKALGVVQGESVEHVLAAGGTSEKILERAELTLSLSTPAPLIAEEHGAVRVIRETVSGSWSGFLWSVERMFVGASLSAPWAILGLLAWLVYRRWRRKEAAGAQAPQAS